MFDTIFIIIEQSFLHIPLMLGAYISFSLLKVPDLSIETAYVVGAIFGSFFLKLELPIPILALTFFTLLASLFGGAIVGLTSSFLTQKGRLPHLLSSIITFGLFHGINQLISSSYVSLNNLSNPLELFDQFPKHPELLMLMLIVFFISCFIFYIFRKQIGYSYAAYGNNPLFFKNYGISTSFIFITGIILANALSGLSGYIFAQSNNFIELNMGLGKALLCITALILGKALISIKRPFSIIIPLTGTFAYFSLQQFLLKAGFNLKYFTAIQAVLVLFILLHTYRKQSGKLSNDNLGV